jgi:hypothetical protein
MYALPLNLNMVFGGKHYFGAGGCGPISSIFEAESPFSLNASNVPSAL